MTINELEERRDRGEERRGGAQPREGDGEVEKEERMVGSNRGGGRELWGAATGL